VRTKFSSYFQKEISMANKNLSLAKQALLEKLLRGEQSAINLPGIPRRPQSSQIKISFPQQRHLFLEFLEPGTSVNSLSVFLEFNGNLDLDALQQSVDQIITRHDVLRTSFCFGQRLPSTKVLDELKITIPIVDLQGFDNASGVSEARRLAEFEVLQPFNLSQAPLIRLRIYLLSHKKHLLLINIHHSIADGWSLGVFLNELMIIYQNITLGKSIQLPELSIQYADFAEWQTHELQAKELQSSLFYWKEQLGGELPVLELPTDQPRGARQTFKGGTYRFVITNDQTKALEELSRQEDSTLFMTLLTAFYFLLHRYSGQDDILVGTPIANRNFPELENLIGVFINTLVLRTDLSGDPSFRELLRQVRKVSLEAYAHQDFPFEKLLEELKPKRDLNRPPLFQVVFNLQNSPMPQLEMEGLDIAFLDIDSGGSQFDLTLMISKIEGQCHAAVEYNADLFTPATITRMFLSFQLLLEYALNQPDSPISTIQLVTQEERQHVVFELNRTQLDFPRGKCIHQLIEEQVEKTPDAIAIIYDQTRISYRELNGRANALAKYLRVLGVGPEIRVGILMKKSAEIVEVLLGVLKAGGAYIPINISFPNERVQFILKDANVELLLTNINPGPLHGYTGLVVNLQDKKFSPGTDFVNPRTPVNADNLAYIIYTSGSTGQPKGVMVNHSSLVNFLWVTSKKPGMNESTVLLSLASIAFDISTQELFQPLMTGATVVIASEEMTTNPLLIIETISRQHVNMLQATPATWQLLLDAGWSGKPDLKALCGGDVMTRKMADQLLGRVGSLWNMYGPTETTVWCSFCQIQNDNKPITIGRPIGNVQIYILDRYLQLVPVGVIGELHIAGEGLARSYLNSPELTNEKFIPDFISAKTGARLYKTGDLARYLPDYNIEILGRMDDQVKVQGHRMELGEITSVLMQHPSVNDGIVITRTETSGDKRLVAYYVPKNGQSPDLAELREFIGKKLPAYMIPSFFISMDCLPLTPNGKIDRKSLPVPEDNSTHSGYIAPRNEEEQILAKIWSNALGIERVGVQDNFFDLGGASMQSIEIVAKANMCGFRLSVENIFEFQTIAELAAKIRET
jgi:amino acid adenylation domain-containing protein